MVDAACEEECQSVGIDPPYHRPNPKRLSIRRDKLKPNRSAAPKPYPGSDLRTLRANVYRLTRMATPPCFDEHGPRDTRSRILSAFPLVVYDRHSFT